MYPCRDRPAARLCLLLRGSAVRAGDGDLHGGEHKPVYLHNNKYLYISRYTHIYRAIYLNISTGGHPPRDRALQQRQAQGQGGDQAGTDT